MLYRNKTMLRIGGDFPIVPPPSMGIAFRRRAGATAKRLAPRERNQRLLRKKRAATRPNSLRE